MSSPTFYGMKPSMTCCGLTEATAGGYALDNAEEVAKFTEYVKTHRPTGQQTMATYVMQPQYLRRNSSSEPFTPNVALNTEIYKALEANGWEMIKTWRSRSGYPIFMFALEYVKLTEEVSNFVDLTPAMEIG